MKNYKSLDIDPEDLEYFLLKVENSYGIKFLDGELMHVQTFGELSDHIKNKISLKRIDDCTTQQAFYKFREAIERTLGLGKEIITPDTLLSEILPKRERKCKVKEIEEALGFEVNLIGPPDYLLIGLSITLLGSIICLFFNWPFGITGFLLSIGGFKLSAKYGDELKTRTLGEVAEQMARENYLKSRRNPSTFNENEIENLLTYWITDAFYLDKDLLTRESRLF